MPYTVPDLPYDYAALEPHVDEATMRVHHDKHHQAYVDNANAALAGTELDGRPVEQVLVELDLLPEDKQAAVRNNAGGHANHTLFWEIMSPSGGGEPSGALADAIASTFDSLDALKQLMNETDPQVLRRRAAPRHRRLGARLLPPVPEPAARLSRRLVERRQLERGRAALRGRGRDLSARPRPRGPESRSISGAERHRLRCRPQDVRALPARPSETTGRAAWHSYRRLIFCVPLCESR